MQTKSWFLIGALLFLFSCKGDIAAMKVVKGRKDAPSEVIKNFHLQFNEHGYSKLGIYADLAETYVGKQRITQLKDSLKVDFYNANGEIQSSLYAKYGEINFDSGEMFVKDSVHFHNLADDRHMYTTIMFWNQKDSMIYTNEKVRLVSSKGVGYGDSFKAKQDFSYYKITRPRGKYEFNQD